jgi:hypothetical protein
LTSSARFLAVSYSQLPQLTWFSLEFVLRRVNSARLVPHSLNRTLLMSLLATDSTARVCKCVLPRTSWSLLVMASSMALRLDGAIWIILRCEVAVSVHEIHRRGV